MKKLFVLMLLSVAMVSGCGDETERNDAASVQMGMIMSVLSTYRQHVGQYPSTESGLEALRTPPSDANLQKKWRGPYLQKPVPTDPWGGAWNYERLYDPQTNRTKYRIWSNGADMSPDTDDDIGGYN
jgi:general secretion pathway protein G